MAKYYSRAIGLCEPVGTGKLPMVVAAIGGSCISITSNDFFSAYICVAAERQTKENISDLRD